MVNFVDKGANVQTTNPGYVRNVDAYSALAPRAIA